MQKYIFFAELTTKNKEKCPDLLRQKTILWTNQAKDPLKLSTICNSAQFKEAGEPRFVEYGTDIRTEAYKGDGATISTTFLQQRQK